MPSQLGVRRQSASAQRRLLETLSIRRVPIPWPLLGYAPDLNENLVGPRAARSARGFVLRGGSLRNDGGWERLDPDNLPLGDNGGVPALAAPLAQPIVSLHRFFRRDTNTLEQLAITGDTGAASETGHVFKIRDTGPWQTVAYAGGGGDEIGGTAATVRRNRFDGAPYPPGGTAGYFIFTNWDGAAGDPVYFYDPAANTFAPLFSGIPQAPFYARSVEIVDGRLVFLHTAEGGTGSADRHPRRVRWTNAGVASPGLDPGPSPGAGSLELTEFQEEGLRALKIGNRVALYFRDGVASLERTGILQAPFRRGYHTKRRGLLAPFAVVPIGRNVHFGIFTDGWYYVNEDFSWQEVGLFDAGGVVLHKWKHTFYEELSQDPAAIQHMTVEYDEAKSEVKVSWPSQGSTTNDRTWTLDILGDRVTPDDQYTVASWGSWNRSLSGGTTYGDFTTYGATFGGKTYGALRAMDVARSLVHGTEDGLVFLHRDDLATRDGIPIPLLWSSHRTSFGSPRVFKTAHRVLVEYQRVAGSNPVSISHTGRGGVAVGQTKPTNEGAIGSLQTAYANMHASSPYHGIEISGSGALDIRGMEMEISSEDGSDVEL